MKQLRAVQLLWLVTIVGLAIFFILRSIWVGMEGLSGIIPLDRRDWMLVTLFLVSGVFLATVAAKLFQKMLLARSKMR